MHRPRDEARARPGSRARQPRPLAEGRRGAAVAEVQRHRSVPRRDPRGALEEVQVLAGHSGQGAAEEGDRRDPAWDRRSPEAHVREPERPEAFLRVRVGGRPAVARAPVSRDDLGVHPRRHRALHERAAVSGLQGQAPQARSSRRDRRRPQHRPGHRAHGRRVSGVDRDAGEGSRRARRPRAPDREAGPEGDPDAPWFPHGRRTRLPHGRPIGDDPLRWRSAADPARDPDRVRAHGRPLHPR